MCFPKENVISLSSIMKKTRVGPDPTTEGGPLSSKIPPASSLQAPGDKDYQPFNVAGKYDAKPKKNKTRFQTAKSVKAKVFKQNYNRSKSQTQIYKGPSLRDWTSFFKRCLFGQHELFLPYREVPISKNTKEKANQDADNNKRALNSQKSSTTPGPFIDFSILELEDIDCEPSVWSVLLMRPMQYSSPFAAVTGQGFETVGSAVRLPKLFSSTNESSSQTQVTADAKKFAVINSPKQVPNNDQLVRFDDFQSNMVKDSINLQPVNDTITSPTTVTEDIKMQQTMPATNTNPDIIIPSSPVQPDLIYVQDVTSPVRQNAVTNSVDTTGSIRNLTPIDVVGSLTSSQNETASTEVASSIVPMTDNSTQPIGPTTSSLMPQNEQEACDIKIIEPDQFISVDSKDISDLPLPPHETFFFPYWDKIQLEQNIGKGAYSKVISAKVGDFEYALKLFRTDEDEELDGEVPSWIVKEAVIMMWVNTKAPGVTPRFSGFVQISKNDNYLQTGLLLESTLDEYSQPAPSLLSVLTAEAELHFKSGGTQFLYSNKKWINMLQGLVNSLGKLHSCFVIHTDLHIANILLPSFENPVIIDFGEAVYNTKCHTIPLIGESTLRIHLVAPEKILGLRPSTTWDIYSLGTIMNKVESATGMMCLTEVIKECQSYNPLDRITLQDLAAKLDNLKYSV